MVSIIFAVCGYFSIAQTDKNLSIEISPILDQLMIKIHAPYDSLGRWELKLQDQENKIVKTIQVTQAVNSKEHYIPINDLLPGKYTCLVLKDTTMVYKQTISKDALFTEPQKQPVINPKNH